MSNWYCSAAKPKRNRRTIFFLDMFKCCTNTWLQGRSQLSKWDFPRWYRDRVSRSTVCLTFLHEPFTMFIKGLLSSFNPKLFSAHVELSTVLKLSKWFLFTPVLSLRGCWFAEIMNRLAELHKVTCLFLKSSARKKSASTITSCPSCTRFVEQSVWT